MVKEQEKTADGQIYEDAVEDNLTIEAPDDIKIAKCVR
jgi:hypothetical protein